MKKPKRAAVIFAGLLGLAGLGGFAVLKVPDHVVAFDDPGLAAVPFGYALHGKPFTGAVYSRRASDAAARLLFVWGGRLTWREYQWYPSGALHVQRSFRNGLEHGEQKTWYPTGEPFSYSVYEDGMRDGESWSWHEDGTPAAFALHHRGEEIAIKSFSYRQKPFNNYVRSGAEVVGLRGDMKCDKPKFVRR